MSRTRGLRGETVVQGTPPSWRQGQAPGFIRESLTGNPWGDHVLFAASAAVDGGVLHTAYFEKAASALSAVLHAIAEREAPDLLSPGQLE